MFNDALMHISALPQNLVYAFLDKWTF